MKLWLSYEAYFGPLSAAEVGRLTLAMMEYKSQGVEPVFAGNERFVWPAIKRDIDEANQSAAEYSAKQSENGKKGGRPKKALENEKATETQKTQAFFDKPKKDMDKGQRTKDNIPPISPNGDSPPAGGSKKRKSAARDVIDAWTQDPELRSLLHEWLDVRKAQRAANTEGAIRQNLAKLPELAQQSGLSMQDYMREIICRSWRAFYPIRDAKPEPRTDGRNFDWMTGH